MAIFKREHVPLVFAIALVFITGSQRNVHGRETSVNAMEYLESFGYLTLKNEKSSNTEFETALKSFQYFAGTHVTGHLNRETIHKMHKPRCGMTDMIVKEKRRERRFAIHHSRWFKHRITWRMVNSLPGDRPRDVVLSAIRRAFAKWSAVADITFTERFSGSADIMLLFVKGEHGDSLPFDGRGGVLAHAYYPNNNRGLSGDIHFDSDDHFSLDMKRGRSLHWIALHEIGHSLGLDHSKNKQSVMYPWYRKQPGSNHRLPDDDIAGIQAIYGHPWKSSKSTQSQSDGSEPRSLSSSACIRRVDAVWMDQRQFTYFLTRNTIHILDQDLVPVSRPLQVPFYFPGVKTVDAVLIDKKNRMIVFQNDRYFIFTEKAVVQGSRPLTSLGLPASVRKIDAAFTWKYSGRSYLFAGHRYWRLALDHFVVERNQGREISHYWNGIPDKLDTVFTWHDGKTYFFKGSKYYQFNDRVLAAERPQSISEGWFKCHASLKTKLHSDAWSDYRSKAASLRGALLIYLIPFSIVVWSLCADFSLTHAL